MERKAVSAITSCQVNCVAANKSVNGKKERSIFPGRLIFVLSIFFTFGFQGFSQPKYEKEFRIALKDVPSAARSFVDSLPFISKTKWYKETGLNNITIEAKAKLNKEKYSIEFCEKGIFQDIEIEVTPGKIAYNAYPKISEILSQSHKRFKLRKFKCNIPEPGMWFWGF